MKIHPFRLGIFCLIAFILRAPATTFYVNVNNSAPIPPYATWDTAATNIQDAIAATSSGDTVLVTNGVYAFGGAVMAGNLTNRVALTNAITVQSVNGAWVTTILGAGATNGTVAVRCARLTNGASLVGFTLMAGATRTSGDTTNLRSGGAIWCASSNAFVGNCVIVSNTASSYGGGIYQGTVNNSLIASNGIGLFSGGTAYGLVLNNCTIVSNTAGVSYPLAMTNCIIYFNNNGNYVGSGSAYSHCCMAQTLAGTGNFTAAPLLFADDIHLSTNSPCIGAGIAIATGTDIFGAAWSNPPSVGCAEWTPLPLVTTPQIKLTGDPVGFTVGNFAVGTPSACSFSWLKDGVLLQDNGHFSSTQTTNLIATGVSSADAGNYQVIVSNAFGMVTSSVATLVVHCVDAAATSPIAPYSTWATAAANIQDAITASAAGDVVLVTNGLYASGGESMDGVITNRVSIDKAILVQSVKGANATVIQGAWDPTSTNGPGAIRCVWMTNSILNGFTLTGGATRKTGNFLFGGGILGAISNASPVSIVANCIISNNMAQTSGGGADNAILNYCTVVNNGVLNTSSSGNGGGAASCTLKNCLVTGNFAMNGGGGTYYGTARNSAIIGNTAVVESGGAYYGTLINCTLTKNSTTSFTYNYGGGASFATLTSCLVYANQVAGAPGTTSNYYQCTFSFSCAAPLPTGTGNISANPQLLADGIHLAASSPCIGAGSATTASGNDFDGQPWNNPPSIGCDEWQPAPVIGAQPTFQIGSPPHGLTCSVIVAGQTPFSYFWSKDGVPIQDDGHHSNSGTASLIVNNLGPDDAGYYQVIVSNAFGVVTSQLAQVVIHAVSAAGMNPVAPYSTWDTAATNIQDAINISADGDIVLVTNGVYATGGQVMSGDLTNRVALTLPVTVTSVNGYAATVIQGSWDTTATTGPGAVRCAWVGDGAVLSGFTLQNGATRATGDGGSLGGPLQSGGGVWCYSTNGVVANCLLTNNAAFFGGGMAYGSLNNSLVVGNVAQNGGGAFYSTLNNCSVENNAVSLSGGGTYMAIVRNSIVVGNSVNNYYASGQAQYSYSCTTRGSLSGPGNIYVDPRFLDWFHIATTSPCRGAGSAAYASGTDLDGEPWANPPSMGCDEVIVTNLIGPLTVSILASQTNVLVNHSAGFSGQVTGRAATIGWSFGDGVSVTNSATVVAHYWTNSGDYSVTFTAYNMDNPAGVSTNTIIHVQLPSIPQIQSAMLLTNGFQFQFAGQTNANYTIQYATNLAPPVTWQTLQTIYFNQQSIIHILDVSWTNAARFYRVLAQ